MLISTKVVLSQVRGQVFLNISAHALKSGQYASSFETTHITTNKSCPSKDKTTV